MGCVDSVDIDEEISCEVTAKGNFKKKVQARISYITGFHAGKQQSGMKCVGGAWWCLMEKVNNAEWGVYVEYRCA